MQKENGDERAIILVRRIYFSIFIETKVFRNPKSGVLLIQFCDLRTIIEYVQHDVRVTRIIYI